MSRSTSSLRPAAALLCGVALLASATVARAGAADLVGKAAPEIHADAFLGTKPPPSLAALKGKKAVVVEFWATWCPPCRRTIPHLNELSKVHGKKVVFVGLTDEDQKKVEAFQASHEMLYVVGTGSTTIRDYGVQGIPHAFVIGIDGKVQWEGHPLDPAFEKAVEKAAAEVKG